MTNNFILEEMTQYFEFMSNVLLLVGIIALISGFILLRKTVERPECKWRGERAIMSGVVIMSLPQILLEFVGIGIGAANRVSDQLFQGIITHQPEPALAIENSSEVDSALVVVIVMAVISLAFFFIQLFKLENNKIRLNNMTQKVTDDIELSKIESEAIIKKNTPEFTSNISGYMFESKFERDLRSIYLLNRDKKKKRSFLYSI